MLHPTDLIQPRAPESTTHKRRFFTPERILRIFQGGLILYVFLRFARVGLRADFTGDDLNNLYQAWAKPFVKLLGENLLFFTSGYRPLGSLVYRLLFAASGLNPLPFRIAIYVLLIINLYLLYRVASEIATREIAILTALLFCFNASFVELYYNTGTIFDVLCFTFYFAALSLYIGVRKHDRWLTNRQWIVLIVLYICALNSKEMAVTLPAVLLVYELTSGRIKLRQWLPIASLALITLPYVFGKLSGSSPLVGNAGYRLDISLTTYFSSLAHYLAQLAQVPPTLTTGVCAAVILLLSAAALLSSERCLVFAVLFTLITPLPVLFVPPRGGYAMYIPAFGIALYLAATLVLVRDRLLTLKQRRWKIALEGAMFVLCLAGLIRYHRFHTLERPPVTGIGTLVASLSDLRAHVRAPSRILFLDDGFDKEDWTQVFVCRLYFRERNIFVQRIKMLTYKMEQQEIDTYDVIFTYGNNRYTLVKPHG
jgi:hypothetical protein